MAINWFIVFVILTIIEIFTINLVTIWFAIGAIASLLAALYTDSIFVQLIVFIVVSVLSLLITKPLMKRLKIKKIIPTNSDRVIGEIATVTKTIEKDKNGEVKVLGNIWTACSDEKIVAGVKVRVLAIDGVKLIVKVEEE